MTGLKPNNQYGYRAWLLRYWIEPTQKENDERALRFSLEDPHTGHRRGFANLKSFVEFLQAEVMMPREHDEGPKSSHLGGEEHGESNRNKEQE